MVAYWIVSKEYVKFRLLAMDNFAFSLKNLRLFLIKVTSVPQFVFFKFYVY